MSGNVLYVGNALYDICATCEYNVLQRYDLRPDENCEATEKHNSLFTELLNNPSSTFSPGGSAQNSAKFSQWLFQSWDKGQASFVGCIGNDNLGLDLRCKLESAFVNVIYDINEIAPTGLTAALVFKDGTRTLCARLGAAGVFNPEFLTTDKVEKAIKDADIIYVEGYFVSHSVSSVINLAKYADKHSKCFAINLSGEYICEDYFEDLKKCIMLADLVIGNEKEAKAFVKKCNLTDCSIEDCALTITSLPGKRRKVIITQASNPVVVFDGSVVKHFEVPKVEVIDTIGCGDAFVGGLLASLSLQAELSEAVDCGIYCAAEVVTRNGCTLPNVAAKFKLCC